jgi:hypothetical protein
VGTKAITSSTPTPALVFSECHTLDIAPQHPGILVEVGRHGLCTVAGGTGADWLLS